MTKTHFRKLAPLAGVTALAAAAFSACSYNANKPDILLTVDGVAGNAVRAVITLSDTNGDTAVPYYPRFLPQAGRVSNLAFSAPSAGTYTVSIQVQAFDAEDNLVNDGTVATPGPVTFPANPPLQLALTVGAVNSDGTYGSRCIAPADGGPQTCEAGLICVSYQGAGSRGLCTQTCTGVCPTSTAPSATCLPASSGGNACQWECDSPDGGTTVCPPGLQCAAQTGSSKKFCQPPP